MAIITSLTIGPAHTLTAGVTYALPARKVLVRVQLGAGASIECSNDNVTWAAVTLDDDESFEAAATFIRSTVTDSILTLKA